MQLASIPNSVLTANQQVVGSLASAHALTERAQAKVERGDVDQSVRRDLGRALEAATQARDGVRDLGRGNLLDGTFQRYSNHAARDLERAVAMLDRRGDIGADALSILQRHVSDAEVATRLGSQAGERSIANPSPKALERASDFGTGSSDGSGGPAWVDGEWLDELGNPVRGGGDSWTGPDGGSYGWDGSPVGGDGGWVGPDGEGYSGI